MIAAIALMRMISSANLYHAMKMSSDAEITSVFLMLGNFYFKINIKNFQFKLNLCKQFFYRFCDGDKDCRLDKLIKNY